MSDAKDAAASYAEVVEYIGLRRGADETGFQIAFGRCDSPIEQAYCLALFQVPNIRAVAREFEYRDIPLLIGMAPTITVYPQQPILRYRADFLLVGTSPICAEPIFAVIECDGAEYHSAVDQRQRDATRQDEMARSGFKVIRFTGAELFSDPELVGRRTLAAFTKHGWSPSDVPRWIGNGNLRRALAELRAAALVRAASAA